MIALVFTYDDFLYYSYSCQGGRFLMLVDSEVAAWVSGAAETVDYFG